VGAQAQRRSDQQAARLCTVLRATAARTRCPTSHNEMQPGKATSLVRLRYRSSTRGDASRIFLADAAHIAGAAYHTLPNMMGSGTIRQLAAIPSASFSAAHMADTWPQPRQRRAAPPNIICASPSARVDGSGWAIVRLTRTAGRSNHQSPQRINDDSRSASRRALNAIGHGNDPTDQCAAHR
jgi:hypothetical protein